MQRKDGSNKASQFQKGHKSKPLRYIEKLHKKSKKKFTKLDNDQLLELYNSILNLFLEYKLLHIPVIHINSLDHSFLFKYSQLQNDKAYDRLIIIFHYKLFNYGRSYESKQIGFRVKGKTSKNDHYLYPKIDLNDAIIKTTELIDKIELQNIPLARFLVLRDKFKDYTTYSSILVDFITKILFIHNLINDFDNSSEFIYKKNIEKIHCYYVEYTFNREDELIEENILNASKSSNKIIDSENPDAIEEIQKSFLENTKEVLVTELLPLLKNPTFIKTIIEKKIRFCAESHPEISREICSSLISLSNEKGYRKAGNPYAYLNATEPANLFARKMGPIFDNLNEEGFTTLQSKVDELNRLEILTMREKKWGITAVKRTWDRWKKLQDEEETPKSKESPKP